MSKKQADKVNLIVDSTEETKNNTQQEQPEQQEVETADSTEAEPTQLSPSITDAAILGESIYFIRDNSVLFEKRKDGQLLELFVFPSSYYRISIEGFYLNKLVFLINGTLCTINDRRQLVTVVD